MGRACHRQRASWSLPASWRLSAALPLPMPNQEIPNTAGATLPLRVIPRDGHTISRKDISPNALRVLYRLRDGVLAVLSYDHTPESRLGGVGFEYSDESVSHCIELAVGLNQGGRNLEINTTTLFPGDRYLICSDGIDGEIDLARLQQMLASDSTCAQLCEELYAEARMSGSTDDATLIVIEIGE